MAWMHVNAESLDLPAGKSQVISLNEVQVFKSVMEALIAEQVDGENSNIILKKSYVSLLKNLLLESLQKVGKIQKPSRLAKVRRAIHKDLRKKWRVKDLAQIISVSEAHCYRLFMEEEGKTPLQVITEIKMEHAEMILKNTDYKLDLVADMLGFDNQYAFSRVFRKYAGISPGYFRKNNL